MPVISRTERQVTVNATPQPSSSGSGYAAPGKAIDAFGSALGKLAAAAEENEEYNYKIALSDFMYNEDKGLDEAAHHYRGDGTDFATTWEKGFRERSKKFEDQYGGRLHQRAQLDTRQFRNTGGMRAINTQQGLVQQNSLQSLQAHTARIATTIDSTFDSVFPALEALNQGIEQAPGSRASLVRGRHWVGVLCDCTTWQYLGRQVGHFLRERDAHLKKTSSRTSGRPRILREVQSARNMASPSGGIRTATIMRVHHLQFGRRLAVSVMTLSVPGRMAGRARALSRTRRRQSGGTDFMNVHDFMGTVRKNLLDAARSDFGEVIDSARRERSKTELKPRPAAKRRCLGTDETVSPAWGRPGDELSHWVVSLFPASPMSPPN
jgi:hypothetical protein